MPRPDWTDLDMSDQEARAAKNQGSLTWDDLVDPDWDLWAWSKGWDDEEDLEDLEDDEETEEVPRKGRVYTMPEPNHLMPDW